MPGTIPYTKSFYGASSQYLMASTESGAVAVTQPLADFVTCGFDRLWDADLPWSFEADVLIQPDQTTGYNQVFRYDGGGIGTIYIYVNYATPTEIRIKFRVSRAVDGKQYHCQMLFDISDDTHAITTDLSSTGTWLRVSLCKGTGTSIENSNIVQYCNGYTGASQNTWTNHTDLLLDDDLDGTDDEARTLYIATGSTNAIGMVAFYDKQLSSAEVNENYDGGARVGGSADAAEIMVQDLRTTSANANLLYYNFYDSAVDSTNLMEHKIGAIDLQSINTTLANADSQTVPQIPLLKSGSPPNTVYATEAQVFSQPASGTSGTTVKWYSDSGFTSEVEEGTTYSFTAPSAGAQNLYVKETKTWPSPYGAVEQTATFAYTTSNAGGSTHSYTANDGTGTGTYYHHIISGDDGFNDSDFDLSGGHGQINGVANAAVSKVTSKSKAQYQKIVTLDKTQSGGGMTWTHWHASGGNYSYYRLLSASNGAGGVWAINMQGWSTSTPVIQIQNTNGIYSWNPSISEYNTTFGKWNCTTWAWDWIAGKAYVWINGVVGPTITHSDLADPFNEHGGNSIKWDMNQTQYRATGGYGYDLDQLAIYKGVLSNEEVLAINPGGDPGDSVDLSSLSSYSKCIGYWSIDTDTFSNDSEDHINDVKGGSTWDIPVANSIAGLKSVNRP